MICDWISFMHKTTRKNFYLYRSNWITANERNRVLCSYSQYLSSTIQLAKLTIHSTNLIVVKR